MYFTYIHTLVCLSVYLSIYLSIYLREDACVFLVKSKIRLPERTRWLKTFGLAFYFNFLFGIGPGRISTGSNMAKRKHPNLTFIRTLTVLLVILLFVTSLIIHISPAIKD
jgi:hypothetical protein